MRSKQRRLVDHSELSDHEKKNLLILEIIRRKGPIARADIARMTDLNNVTVTSYVDQFLKKKALVEAGVHVSTGGRKPTLVDLDSETALAIGVGINAADFTAVLTDLKGKILHKAKLERTAETIGRPVESIIAAVQHLITESKVDVAKVYGIGVGVPGIVNHNNGTVRWPRGLIEGDLTISNSITNNIYDAFEIPVIIDNDANLAVFGEQWSSEMGHDIKSAVYLYSGSGCGLMFHGRIHRGNSGAAGEFLFDLKKEDPVSWLSGAVESGNWALDLGITAQANVAIKNGTGDKIKECMLSDHVQMQDVASAAQSGDLTATKILEDAGHALGTRAAMLTNLLDPELIIVGGGVEAAGVIFIEAIRQQIKESAVPEASSKVRVAASQLGENAVPMGAAALVVQNFFISV